MESYERLHGRLSGPRNPWNGQAVRRLAAIFIPLCAGTFRAASGEPATPRIRSSKFVEEKHFIRWPIIIKIACVTWIKIRSRTSDNSVMGSSPFDATSCESATYDTESISTQQSALRSHQGRTFWPLWHYGFDQPQKQARLLPDASTFSLVALSPKLLTKPRTA